MEPEGVKSPPVAHKHVLQKGKRLWVTLVWFVPSKVLVEIFLPSERSAKDDDYLDWMDSIIDFDAVKFTTLEVVTHFSDTKITHHTYKVSDFN